MCRVKVLNRGNRIGRFDGTLPVVFFHGKTISKDDTSGLICPVPDLALCLSTLLRWPGDQTSCQKQFLRLGFAYVVQF